MSPLETVGGGTTTSEPIITITDSALAKVLELRADETDPDELGLRLAIASGPGEDFRYDLSFDEYLKADFTDEVRTHTGDAGTIKVIIPAASVESLQEATLDFNDNQGLVIRNPNRPAAPDIEGLINDDELSAQIETIVAAEVNPALAGHGGFVTYVGHDGEGVVYMTMGGGCHGCSMSKMTMLEGVLTMLQAQLPDQVKNVRDLTDHSTGSNPYYT